MSVIYKFLGTEISIGSANTVANSKLVRVTGDSANQVLTIANTTATYANVTILAGEILVIEKATTDTLQGTNLKAVPVAYRN
jgi:hypothetical protein